MFTNSPNEATPQNINQRDPFPHQQQGPFTNNPDSGLGSESHHQQQHQQQSHLSNQSQLNDFQQSSFSSQFNAPSSFTSASSPSNFAHYNSPSANPPPAFIHKNSFSSRSGSMDGLNNSQHPNLSSSNNNSYSGNSFLAPSSVSSSHIAPAGRRSLLTSKLQGQRAQQQPQQQPSQPVGYDSQPQSSFFNPSSSFQDSTGSSSFNHSQVLRNQQAQQFAPFHNTPSQVSSSYNQQRGLQTDQLQSGFVNIEPSVSSSYTQTSFGFQPQPAPATATTTISKDLAFSTNSSSSTLYQDAQQSVTPSHTGSVASQSIQGQQNQQMPPPQLDQHIHLQQQQQQQRPHFMSASAPTHAFDYTSSSFPTNNPNQYVPPNQSNRGTLNESGSNLTQPFHQQQQQQRSQQQTNQFSSSLFRYPDSTSKQIPSFRQQSITPSIPSPESDHINIAEHNVQDLLLMLSALLQKIVEANDLLHPDHYNSGASAAAQNQSASASMTEQNKYTANVLAFHGRNIPAITLHAYLTRILKYCPVTNEVFLSLLVYFDRIAKRANNGEFNSTFGSGGTQPSNSPGSNSNDGKDFEMTDEDSQSAGKKQPQLFVMDSYNIHRLIISGITVASKFFSDVFYKNSRYAKVGGLPLEELNHLELQFLLLLDFKLMIQVEEMYRYGDLLMKFWKREQAKVAAQAQQQAEAQSQQQVQAQQEQIRQQEQHHHQPGMDASQQQHDVVNQSGQQQEYH